ncbi:class I adenylate-forming enzyme family protein [Bradyrhizobium lablabi]|uniref:class I adenylate-forming enzyme family protein n=1 Tax=Bradyrhizobium lablabi TaxID=722472 RepID=UPI001BA97EBB|nr:class I adenylate-forming enzyme family protein [Bradyrhizobium lablabi]MBR0694242.1 acyl--CoA ligase [Bradyrhizobium lablabi]
MVRPTEVLMQQAKSRPQGAAFTFQERVWTYHRLAHESECVARGLAAIGVKAGDRVVLHMMNRPEMLVAYYACFRLGAIAAPLRTAFRFAELAPMLQRLQPALYIGQSSLYPNVEAVDAAILPHERRVILDDADGTHGVQPWEVLQQFAGAELPIPPSSEPAVLINTSGSTGQPKFVMHTQDTLAAMTPLLGKHFDFSANDVIISPLQLAHGSGLFCSLSFVQAGLPFVMLQTADPDGILDSIERYRATWLLGFPYQYAGLLEAQQARPRDVSSLRICLTGADTCPVDLQNRVSAALGAPLYNVWASTEVVGQLTYGRQPGPVVRITKDAQIRLVDEYGVDVAHGEIGELLIRGKNVFVGYWNDPAATAQSLKDGWYHTGDLMRRGHGDELWFVSRKKDIIIRGGTNISPAEVEEALVACHPAVVEAAVVGKPDPVLGQRVFGFVRLTEGANERIVAEILQNVGKRLAPFKVPEGLRVIDALPRNALSKVDRRALEKLIAEDESTAGSRSAAVSSRAGGGLPARRIAQKR